MSIEFDVDGFFKAGGDMRREMGWCSRIAASYSASDEFFINGVVVASRDWPRPSCAACGDTLDCSLASGQSGEVLPDVRSATKIPLSPR
jgi:hypothetical protein